LPSRRSILKRAPAYEERVMIFLYILGGIAMATLLFANFAEALAEGRGKAQAATLRKAHRHAGETAHRS
jgi:high-affinity K+ transport system ATPase subunit B